MEKEGIDFNDSEFGCIYSDADLTKFKPNIIAKLPSQDLFKFNSSPVGGFPDIPEHEKYLKDCKFLDDTCYSNISAIVTEKYRDHAIVYLMQPARRPAVIFCCCIENFDDVEVGVWLKVTANLLEIPFNGANERLFNLYCTNVKLDFSDLLLQSEVKDGVKVFLNEIQVSFNTASKVKQCEKGWIFYDDIGSILIRHEYSPMFNLRKGHFVGDLRSMIQGVGQNEYVCWMLCPTFKVFKIRNGELHQKCVNGVFQPIPKKPRTQRPTRPRVLQTAFTRHKLADFDKKNHESKDQEDESQPIIPETLPPRRQKNVGERLAEIFFNKRRFR